MTATGNKSSALNPGRRRFSRQDPALQRTHSVRECRHSSPPPSTLNALAFVAVLLLACGAPLAQCQHHQLTSPTTTSAAIERSATTSGPPVTSTTHRSAPAATFAASAALPGVAGPQPSCDNVRSVLELRGFSEAQLNEQASTASSATGMLRFCEIPAKGACCQNNMERTLASLSRQQLEKNTKESISKLASVLGTRATKFNTFFKQLLAESRREFHEMFKRTYGVIYEQNAYVFSDMFTELENYFTRGKVDLAEALDSFFNVLYQKMFSVINAQYSFDDKYLLCVSEHMKELRPFGDVPEKLSVQIKRSFVATRTYEQALSVAAEVARNLIAVRPSAECTGALTRMQQCGLCRGYAQKPCSNYCVNVMKGCLHYYDELDAEWDNFVASMERVSERLLGPFNIVMVVEPMNIKVSEAIMNFQETGDEITKQVFHGCGKPQLDHRKRRSVSPRFATSDSNVPDVTEVVRLADREDDDSGFRFAEESEAELERRSRRARRSPEPGNRELQFEPLSFDSAPEADAPKRTGGASGRRKTSSKQRQQHQQLQHQQQIGGRNAGRDEKREPVIDKLVKDIRQKVKDSKRFWSNLPFQICNQDDYAASVVGLEGNCWNGNTVDKYPHVIAQDIASNPEFQTAAARQSSLVAQQLYALKNAVGNLRNAYNGLDVEWNDVEDAYDGSGSGSGAGDDDEDAGGSGLGGYDYPVSVDEPEAGGSPAPPSGGTHPPSVVVTSSTDTYDVHDNEIDGTADGGRRGTASRFGAGMSLRQALVTYMFPIYVAWFGGVLCDLF